MTIEIRRATSSDADALGAMHGQCWDETYRGLVADSEIDRKIATTVESWRTQFAQSPEPIVWLGYVDGQLAGFISVAERGAEDPRPLEICALYILQEYHRSGLGTMLMDTAVGDAPAFLWCIEGNTSAENFYRARGFTPGRLEPWTAAGVNDVLYTR